MLCYIIPIMQIIAEKTPVLLIYADITINQSLLNPALA